MHFEKAKLYTTLFAIQAATKHCTITERNKKEKTDKSVIHSIITYSQRDRTTVYWLLRTSVHQQITIVEKQSDNAGDRNLWVIGIFFVQ